MSSDKLDKKIIEAAVNHHPPYDEDAWKNMKQLLDMHLPEEKNKKRRFIFFLFFLLLVFGVSGIWYFSFNNKSSKIKNIQSSISNTDKKESIVEKNIISYKNEKKSNSTIIADVEHRKVKEKRVYLSNLDNELTSKRSIVNILPHKLIKKFNEDIKRKVGNTDQTDESPIVIRKISIGEISKKENIIEADNKEKELDSGHTEIKMETDSIDNATIIVDTFTKAYDTVIEKKEVTSKKPGDRNKKNGFFSISVTGGPDLSFVVSDKLGTTKIIGGLGVSYTFKNGLSLRTGFYSGRKVYSAFPDSYNPPAGFWQYYPIMESIDADCKIYEIPVSVVYNFMPIKKNNWFVGAGLSSLIMKEEKYTYTYKYNTAGTSYTKDWIINNKNKHYLSMLTLSGGYQYKLNKSISLSLEPYFKFPLQGIGYGKVKLNSAGVMFTVSVMPFDSSNK